MAETKKIEILDKDGNTLLPITNAAYVTNASGASLENVEAGAQVNKIESIKYNGTALSISSKSVALPVFTMKKLATPTSGYAASYQLQKDGTAVGDTINIAKDMVLQNVELKTCTTADQPVAGYKVGDKYFDFTFQNKSDHIYLLATDLVDAYTAGTGIDITNNVVKNTGVTAVAQGDNNGTIKVTTNGTATSVSVKGLGSAAYTASTAYAAATHNQASNTINALTGYSKGTSSAALAATDTLNAALSKLEVQIGTKQASGSYLTQNDVTSTYSSTGTAPVNGTAVASAISGKQNSNTAVTHTASTAVGGTTTPVYVASNGAATALSYTIAKSVPSDAKFTDTTYSVFTGATSSTAGTAGLVKAPGTGDVNKFLKGDGTWGTVSTSDTKNTAGSTDTSSKIFLVGATSQTTQSQTYSHDTAFVDASGRLNSAAPAANAKDTTVATTAWVVGKGYLTSVPTHNQAASTITAMTGYTKATAAAAIGTSDSLNTAIGKLEYKADQAVYYRVLS